MLIFIGLAIIGLLLYLAFQFYGTEKSKVPLWEGYDVIQYEIEGTKFSLVVADTASRWQKGLMYVRKPVQGFDGMIFTSKHATPQVFWNMNTFEDLDVYWIRDGKVLGKSLLPSIESKGMKTVSSPGPADTVIEIIR